MLRSNAHGEKLPPQHRLLSCVLCALATDQCLLLLVNVFLCDVRVDKAKLCRNVQAARQAQNQKRASLCQAFHLALHGDFQTARDLLHLGNFAEQIDEHEIATKILYNRVLAQLGLCAFRLGEACDISDVVRVRSNGVVARDTVVARLRSGKSKVGRFRSSCVVWCEVQLYLWRIENQNVWLLLSTGQLDHLSRCGDTMKTVHNQHM